MKIANHTILALFLAMAISARADWRVSAETGALFNSNLSNSDRDADEQSAWSWQNSVALGNGFQLGRDSRLNVALDLRSEIWERFDDFDRVGGGVTAGLRYRFGLGRQAPWISLENRLGYDWLQGSGRNNRNEALHLRGGVSLAPRVALEGGYAFEDLGAEDDFFDLQSHRGDVRVVVDLTSALQIALGYSFRDGDVIAYAVPPRPDLVAAASERRPIDTFGSDPLYTAYRVRGQTHSVSVSAGYLINKYFSVQMSYQYSSTAHDPLRYDNHFVAAKVSFAY